ncbi:MAG: hypothetical protein SGJ02_05975 [bacterium]|nr:hypothetical protein [bacterium]
MNIYEQERIDGLAEQISANTSIAYQCLATKDNTPADTEADKLAIKKTIAGFIEDGRNFDLYHISSILASVDDNKNDDWFLPEEIWAARNTPIYKQVNFGHNEKDIVGVITGTAILNSDGTQIFDEEDIQNIKDIVDHSVIWSYWEDESLKSRFDQIVDDVENDRLFVSMESLFKNFDYMMVTKGGLRSIVTRNKSTAFLTKHLRIYGGSGEYNNSRIYRLLRNFTFSGKALVETPANARSIISEGLSQLNQRNDLEEIDEVCCEKTDGQVNPQIIQNLDKSINSLAEKIMDPNEIALKAVQAELAQAKAELEAHKAAEAEKTSAEITDLKAVNENLQKQVAELTQVAEAAKKSSDEKKTAFEEMLAKKKAEGEKDLEDAKAKILVLESEKAIASRLAKLTAVNVESAKAEEVLKTFASVSDEHFDKIVDLYAITKTEEKTEDEGFDLDTSKSTANDINLNGNDSADKAVAKEKLLAAKIIEQFKFSTKTKKGSK